MSFWAEPIFVSDGFSIEPDNSQALTKYIYYVLKSKQYDIYKIQQRGGGVPHVYIKNIRFFRVPVPPLCIQQKIVDILDNFDALVNDLSIGLPAEITARRKQYEYYRNQLLNFKEAA